MHDWPYPGLYVSTILSVYSVGDRFVLHIARAHFCLHKGASVRTETHCCAERPKFLFKLKRTCALDVYGFVCDIWRKSPRTRTHKTRTSLSVLLLCFRGVSTTKTKGTFSTCKRPAHKESGAISGLAEIRVVKIVFALSILSLVKKKTYNDFFPVNSNVSCLKLVLKKDHCREVLTIYGWDVL